MDKLMLKKAMRVAKTILPPSGKVTYKTVKTADDSFYARITLSNIDPHLIEFNENVINAHFKTHNITELHKQYLFLVQVALHELSHTHINNIIKKQETQETVCEIIESVFKNLIHNIGNLEYE